SNVRIRTGEGPRPRERLSLSPPGRLGQERVMAEQTAAAPPARRAAFGFIFAVALINSISFGLMIPILPNLIKMFTGGDTAAASEWNVVFAVTWGALQFVFAPILGMLSDRVGRRPVLLVSLFGLAIDFLVMALAPNLR